MMVSDGEFYFEIMIVFAGGTSAIRFLQFWKDSKRDVIATDV
jgi:hypothetical protein